jgi:hypothetical protein
MPINYPEFKQPNLVIPPTAENFDLIDDFRQAFDDNVLSIASAGSFRSNGVPRRSGLLPSPRRSSP